MKKVLMVFLAAFILLLCACGNTDTTADPTPKPSETSVPTATPTPDFSGVDFSGRWYVFDIIDSNGMSVTDAQKQNLGAEFTLELISNGTYFVYDQDSKVLGQGTYSVTLNQLTLAAEGSETVYEIVDNDTMRVVQTDTSITIMKREADETLEDDIITDDIADDATEDEAETDFIDEEDTSSSEPESSAEPDSTTSNDSSQSADPDSVASDDSSQSAETTPSNTSTVE